MSDRFPLILNTSTNQIQEIASGDTLDLTGNNIKGVGIITATTISGTLSGIATLARGLTDIPSINVTNITGVGATFSKDLDVDGHTNLDNVSISGVVTATTFSGSGASLTGIANANVASNAAISGSKISPNFGSQDILTTGLIALNGTQPTIQLNDSNANDDFAIRNVDGLFGIRDITNGVDRLTIGSDGTVDVTGNLDVGAGIDVTGNSTFVNDIDVDGHTNLDNVNVVGVLTVTGAVNASHSTFGNLNITGLTIQNTNATILFNDTNNNPDYRAAADGGVFDIDQYNNGGSDINVVKINTDGHIDIGTNVDFAAGIDVTGNATVSGNLSVGGVLTYEDVTNVDSVGIVTARTGLKVLAGGANVAGVVTATGGVFVPDNNQIQLGNAAGSADLRIHSNGTESFVDSYGGNFYIRVTDQAGGVENKLIARPNAQTELYYNVTKRLETTNSGISVAGNAVVTGNVQINDSQFLNVGNSGDLRIHHDQVNTINYINSQNGNLRIQQGGNTLIQLTGTVAKLYGSGSEKLATSNTGITVTGTVAATSYTGDGSNLTGISVGITTEQVTPSSNVATLNLAKDDHKIVASGTYTIDVSGGTEAGSHTLRIENSGTANVGFSTYFKFPSGGTPSLPTTSGAISLISFSVHKVGSVGIATVLLAGASVNFS